MDWLSFWKRKSDGAAPPPSATPVDSVASVRTRARRRLIGAAALVLAGIVGFPLVFETQPRPIPIDLPIDIPRKENAAPLAAPAPRAASAAAHADLPPSAASSASVVVAPAAATASAPAEQIITEGPDEPAPARAAPHEAASAASSPPKRPATSADDGSRARALLEAQPGAAPTASAAAGRFIVQVGAFADETQARQTRLKVERLGMKTYTQVANTPAGTRTRVRVGPFASRDEADRAASKAKAAGLPAVVLTL